MTPPPRPMPPMAPPGGSPIAGATQGMPAPPQGNPVKALFDQTMAGATKLIQILAQAPGVDRPKLQQAVQLLQQGLKMLGEAIPKPGMPPGAPAPTPPGAQPAPHVGPPGA